MDPRRRSSKSLAPVTNPRKGTRKLCPALRRDWPTTGGPPRLTNGVHVAGVFVRPLKSRTPPSCRDADPDKGRVTLVVRTRDLSRPLMGNSTLSKGSVLDPPEKGGCQGGVKGEEGCGRTRVEPVLPSLTPSTPMEDLASRNV